MRVSLEMKRQISWQELGSEHPFIEPEPACGISVGVAKKVVSNWTNRNHKKHWESVSRLTQAKGLIVGPSARRTKDLLKLNRDQDGWEDYLRDTVT
jgi:hypothetical protein